MGQGLKRSVSCLPWHLRLVDRYTLREQSPFQEWTVSRHRTTSHLSLFHKRHVQARLVKSVWISPHRVTGLLPFCQRHPGSKDGFRSAYCDRNPWRVALYFLVVLSTRNPKRGCLRDQRGVLRSRLSMSDLTFPTQARGMQVKLCQDSGSLVSGGVLSNHEYTRHI
jgi:hypothetical protein